MQSSSTQAQTQNGRFHSGQLCPQLSNVLVRRDCIVMMVTVTVGLVVYFTLMTAQEARIVEWPALESALYGEKYAVDSQTPARAIQRQLAGAPPKRRLVLGLVSDTTLWPLLDKLMDQTKTGMWVYTGPFSLYAIKQLWHGGEPCVYGRLDDAFFRAGGGGGGVEENHTQPAGLFENLHQATVLEKRYQLRLDIVLLQEFLIKSVDRHCATLPTHHNKNERAHFDARSAPFMAALMRQARRMQQVRLGVEEAKKKYGGPTAPWLDIRLHTVSVEQLTWNAPKDSHRTRDTNPAANVQKIPVDRWMRQHLSVEIAKKRGSPKLGEDPCATRLKSTGFFIDWLASRSLPQLQQIPPLPHLAAWREGKPHFLVGITQVLNVGHTLRGFVDNVLGVADRLLLLDTGSKDDTLEVVQQLAADGGRVFVRNAASVDQLKSRADNGSGIIPVWDEGANYRRLLEWARKMGATHIMCTDTDEYVTATWHRHGLLRNLLLALPPGTALTTRLFHVYDGVDRWIARPAPGWQQVQRTAVGWSDDGKAHRGRARHHLQRVPPTYKQLALGRKTGLLGMIHFKFASLMGMRVKMVWYRHMEYGSGSKSRALGSFYAAKKPSIKGNTLGPVPKMAWYGQETVPDWASRWTDPETWQWRVDMVHAWRQSWAAKGKKGGIPRPLSLPKWWPPQGAALPASNTKPTTPVVATAAATVANTSFDEQCRRHWTESTNAVMARLVPTRTAFGARFLWAIAPDGTIPKWLQQHEAHVQAFVGDRLRAYAAAGGGKPQHKQGAVARAVVLDIGANSGFYGLAGLSQGYRALFVEPQPYCSMLLQTSLAANGWNRGNRSLILRAAAGDADRGDGITVWCDTPCYGRVGAPGVGAPKGTKQTTKSTGAADAALAKFRGVRPMRRLASHPWFADPSTDIALLKIDVEGAEASVLRGLWPLFQRRAVYAATIEVTPQFYRQWKRESAMRQEIFREMRRIQQAGYEIHRPGASGKYGSYTPMRGQQELEAYLLRGRFNQHDVFLYRAA